MKKVVLLISLAFLSSGCGTVLSIAEDNQEYLVYGGLRIDSEIAFSSEFFSDMYLARTLAVVDMPLSLVADALCLPYTISRSIVKD